MTNNHLKKIAANRNWRIDRKDNKFITKPSAGSHSQQLSYPLVVLLRDVLKLGNTKKEIRDVMLNKNLLIDQKKVKDDKLPVGVMDTVHIKENSEAYRITVSHKGLEPVQIDEKEATKKISKIKDKTYVKGKVQLNLFDGNNLFVDKDNYNVNDSVVIELPSKKIVKHLKFAKGATIMLTGGKHVGSVGVVENIEDNKLVFKSNKGDVFETLKKHAYVVGEKQPYIKVQ